MRKSQRRGGSEAGLAFPCVGCPTARESPDLASRGTSIPGVSRSRLSGSEIRSTRTKIAYTTSLRTCYRLQHRAHSHAQTPLTLSLSTEGIGAPRPAALEG